MGVISQHVGQNIVLLLLAGLVLGLLPSTIADRRGLRLIADIGAALVVTLAVGWLLVSWRDLVPAPHKAQPEKSMLETGLEEWPNYEPVVLPLKPLRPLFKPTIHRSSEEICDALTRAAQKNNLPVHFLIRLLYQESSFRPSALSSAGAQGIAQFMPETATDRRLDNPFDPVQAIPASARLLRDLNKKFGNLGLAAAAYNAGPKRIEDWQANKGPLPGETIDYVKVVTGYPVETWTGAFSGSPALKIPQSAPCQEAVGLLAWDGPDEIPLPSPDPRPKGVPHTKTARSATKPSEASSAHSRIRKKESSRTETTGSALARDQR